ncbi:MAG: hypothetical protein LC113_10875 [Acidobacteria bacterium]|nr:hypothetical protein [Acidobacteriota bacterium]
MSVTDPPVANISKTHTEPAGDTGNTSVVTSVTIRKVFSNKALASVTGRKSVLSCRTVTASSYAFFNQLASNGLFTHQGAQFFISSLIELALAHQLNSPFTERKYNREGVDQKL